ncbi:MAG TPA: YqgE/AlgH family protein [Cytophagaceae bacterium]|jgi:putative transcriptional regulator|nr:YqgE/AlgH family protein [Cytophagaceae bacterium]
MIRTGDILISEPYLGDGNFERSVILLVDHNEEGSLGFILNQKSSLFLTDVVEDTFDLELPLFVGGPVEQNTLHFIYRNKLPLEGTVSITGNLFWGGNFEQVKLMLKNGQIRKNDIRFFLGYSGWSKGQLKAEMKEKSWITHKMEEVDIFELDSKEMWRSVLKKMGGQFKILANYPIDPRLN